MGMASSQARLLHLTGRMHQLEYKAQRLEAQKLQLANESDRVYNEYLETLDATKIQFRTLNSDGTPTFVDATLNALENGAIPGYNSCVTSYESFLLYDGTNNVVKVTQEFANKFHINGGTATDPGTLEDYLATNGVHKQPVPDTYQLTDGISVHEIPAAGAVYSPSGTTPTVSAAAGTPTPVDIATILTNTDPHKTYTISSAEELNKLADYVNRGADTTGVNIILTNNIAVPSGWSSIDNFRGTFNGNGYTISGLDDALFNSLYGDVTNLCIDGANINKSISLKMGTLANNADHASISDIKVTNSAVNGQYDVGGLVGDATRTNISSSTFQGTVSGTSQVGGLVGMAESGTVITSCKSDTTVTGKSKVGGLVGYSSGAASNRCKITQSASSGTVKINSGATGGDSGFGGLVGQLYNSDVSYCDSNASIDSSSAPSETYSGVGGFVGATYASTIDHCASASSHVLASSSNAGAKGYGIFLGEGDASSTISNSNLCTPSSNVIGTANGITVTNCHVTGSAGTQITCADGTTYANTGSSVPNTGVQSYISPNIVTTLHPTSADSTAMADVLESTPGMGTLTVNGSDEQLKKYIAYKIGGSSNYATAYADITGRSYDTYQLAEMVDLVNSGSYTSVSNLTARLVNKYDSSKYNIDRHNITYDVTQTGTATPNTVNTSSTDDIKTRLAYDVWALNGTGDIATVKSQINALGFSNEELASLASYYGKSEWATIVSALATATSKSDVSGYTGKYMGWTVVPDATSKLTVTTVHHDPDYVKDATYYRLVDEWTKQKALLNYKYEIVDPNLASDPDYVSNWITQSGAHLLRFGGQNADGTMNMVETNVSVETSLQEVSNEKNLKKAEAKYEADMKRIDNKDKKYDTDLAALETERSATKEEIETLKNVEKDNVERTFKLFS